MPKPLTRRFSLLLALLLAVLPACEQQPPAQSTQPAAAPTSVDASFSRTQTPPAESTGDRPADKRSLAAQRAELDKTVWNKEVLAQEYEQAFVRVWDAMLVQRRLPDGEPLTVLSDIQFETMQLGSPGTKRNLDHQISVTRLDGDAQRIEMQRWKELVEQFRSDGYQLVQSEWHHAEFEPDHNGQPRSKISMALYVLHPEREQRLVIRGHLQIDWQNERDSNGLPVPDHIDATDLQIESRTGPPAFRELLTVDHARRDTRSGVHPVIVYDLNRDGLSEIMLVGSNELFWNQGNGEFSKEDLFAFPERAFETGIVADVTGDGYVDLLMPGMRGDLLLYAGQEDGRFSKPPVGKARGGGPLAQPQVMTAGDIDGDGDLDLWIGQYKISYVGGQMPNPYYDANDGFPAFLLLNDGQGRFSPATEEAGLAEKRFRRSYGGSFVDIDTDGDLDLLVVSDFSGVDLYENNGSGYFTDVTDERIDERHLFGMSSAFADFNLDGRLDFFATGMASTTARRLEYMKLGRRDRPEIHMMRSRMGYGNRMYVADESGFRQPAFIDQVARTGWSWGSTAADFDNDGDPDLFVANGHSSGESTKDHCSHFWCHDIYEGSSDPNQAVESLFNDVLKGYYDRSESWDGYQKNVLLMNQQGRGFENIAFLMGVGQDFDGRAAVSDDLDGDGRLDLLVVEDRWNNGQILHVYQNQLSNDNHWIGFRLTGLSRGRSPLGCRVTAQTGNRVYTSHVISGDSIHAQHAAAVHFGLGPETHVKSVEVNWIDGHSERLVNPAIDQYHTIRRRDAAPRAAPDDSASEDSASEDSASGDSAGNPASDEN